MNSLIFLDECGSTNDYIREHLAELPDGAAVTARLQTAGRGRRGHTWSANDGMLPLSILFKNPIERDTLTARAGLAVCEALESVCILPEVSIKWPNDVIIAQKKVCGILCECSIMGDTACVICGIGVNVSQNEEFFRENNLPNGGSLLTITGTAPEREVLFRAIAERVKQRVETPFADCLGDFKARVLNIGRTVRIIGENRERTAVAVDIAPNGFLVCEDENGRFEVGSGEVSVRGENGYL
ncbi:MAG: biotin--[acetyl-CoA-carboxylase] ligase [Oscillospiraceae bacterium]